MFSFILISIQQFCYCVEVTLNKIGAIGHRRYGNNTYPKANKSCKEMTDESPQYTKGLGFKITEKEKILPNMYWIPKIHKNPTGIRFTICFTKYLNMLPMSLSSYPPKLKIFIKMLDSYQIMTSFGSYKILTLSFNR